MAPDAPADPVALSPWFQHRHAGHPAATPETCGALVLETRHQENKTVDTGMLVIAPNLGDDYWSYRVRLSDTQAIVGFPKFFTIGIGFAIEDDDWNTNLPYTCPAQDIYDHIAGNKGDDNITRDDCLTAIRMIQTAAAGSQT